VSVGERVLVERRLYGLMLALGAVVLVVDQASKLWAVSALSDGRRITVIPHVIELRLLYNSGAAFSIGTNATWVFALTAVAAVAGILYAGRRLGSRPWAYALGVLLGGATSHLLDRLLRAPGFARGHVVDFIDYNGLFVGNIADIALTGGVAVLLLLGLRGIPLNGVTHPEQES
jgi:signal peptidase II